MPSNVKKAGKLNSTSQCQRGKSTHFLLERSVDTILCPFVLIILSFTERDISPIPSQQVGLH